jgi:hypothetical protein
MRKSTWLLLLVGSIVLGFGMTGAGAQTYGTDFITFKGYGKIIDNPTNATCQGAGINTGTRYIVTYRFTANAGLIADALSIQSEAGSLYRIISTSASKSLNGAQPTDWVLINRFSNFSSGSATSTLTIQSGLNAPVSLGTGNIKITNGQINSFFLPGCNISNFHAAMVVIAQ